MENGIHTRLRRSFWRRIIKRWRRRAVTAVARWQLLLAALVIVFLGMAPMFLSPHDRPDPAAYAPLLSTIAKGESGGNYNAYFGSPANTFVRFTDMTVGEVLTWQADYAAEGHASSAVGKYQIIDSTLKGLVDELKIDRNEKFTEAMQDRLAIALLERRGASEYVQDKLTKEQFAANLAKEWAALPKVTGPNPHESYYASDGLNKSTVTLDEVFAAVDALRQSGEKP